MNLHEIFTYLTTSTPEGMAALRGILADAFGKAGLSGAEPAALAPKAFPLSEAGASMMIDRDAMLAAVGPVFKAPNEILAECQTVGIGPGSSVYLYCFKGARVQHPRRLARGGRHRCPNVFRVLE